MKRFLQVAMFASSVMCTAAGAANAQRVQQAAGAATPAGAAQSLHIGSRVQAIQTVVVRVRVAGARIGIQKKTSAGVIVGGPVVRNRTWWKIDWDNSNTDGWSQDKWLQETASTPDSPNIVVVMTDDQDDQKSLKVMRNVQRLLIREGVHFTNSFVNFSHCCPSRTSFLTGLATHNHTVRGSSPKEDGGYAKVYKLGLENHTLGVWLQNAGYTTGFMGKYLNTYGNPNITAPEHVPPGWDQWYGMIKVDYFDYTINENGVVKSYGSAPKDYSTDVLAQKAVDFIKAQRNTTKPFFLVVTPKAPHIAGAGRAGAAVPAPRHYGRFLNYKPNRRNFNERNRRDKPAFVRFSPLMNEDDIAALTAKYQKSREALLAVDDMVRDIISALRRSRKLDDTYIIFTSDNGFVYGAHNLFGKRFVYEESIRVPLVIRGPGVPKGEKRPQLVNNLDLSATIANLAHVQPDVTFDGASLVSLLKDASTPWRSALLVQGDNSPRTKKGLVGRYFAVRTKNYVYAEHVPEPCPASNHDCYYKNWPVEYELYDLRKDMWQLRNRAGNEAYADVTSSLRTLLSTLKTCVGVSCWVTGNVEEVPTAEAVNHEVALSTIYSGPLPREYRSWTEYLNEESQDE